MTEHVVRGYWLTGGVKFFNSHYSPEMNERLLGSLPKALRAILAEIQPVEWYTRAYHVEILKAVVSAHRDETAAYESLLAYGQLVASDLSSGPMRPLFQILTPKLLAKKLPSLWASAHQNDGKLETDIAQIDDGRLALRFVALQGYEHGGVAALGWIKGLLMSLGRREIVMKQAGWKLGQPAPSEMTCEVRWS
jgi:hypothetical protein